MAMKEFLKKIFGHERDSKWQDSGRNMRGERSYDRKRMHPLEGAGRSGWDVQQNAGYGNVYGNPAGPSTYVERGEVRHFRGKGPKNYRRPDEKIQEDINDSLTDDRYLDATNIEVAVKEGEVTLTGFVDDKNAKRRAEDLAEAIYGVRHIENRLKINR
jgi:hypothetical protein